MNRNLLLFVLLLLWSQTALAVDWGAPEQSNFVVNPAVRSAHQSVLSLDGEWNFRTTNALFLRMHKGSGIWGDSTEFGTERTIRIPGSWESQGVGSPGEGVVWECQWDRSFWKVRHIHMGYGAYQKNVGIPADWADKRVFLKVGGVRAQAYIWVNQNRAALVDNYCGTSSFEITPFVEAGKDADIVAVVNNDVPSRKGLLSELHRFGGFYRSVELEAVPKALAAMDLQLKYQFGDAQTMTATVLAEGIPGTQGTAELVLKNAGGRVVTKQALPVKIGEDGRCECRFTFSLKYLKRWSPEEPNLYVADLVLKGADGKPVHGRVERFGVREWRVVGDRFFLNGKPYFLRGGGDHNYDSLTVQEPADREFFKKHLQLYKEAGFNYLRFHTHCPLPEYFEAADEVGMLLQPELPYYHDVQTEGADFDPMRDVKELLANYGRYASLGTVCTGNEGWLGSPVDQKVYECVKAYGDGRLLVLHQDGGHNVPGNSDFGTGPIQPWAPGTFQDGGRPFVAHEYLNLAIKVDPHLESRFTGERVSPVSMDAWRELLAKCRLSEDWGNATLRAAQRLQGIYQKQGLELAHFDPACDGYCYWSLVDAGATTAQGWLTPFVEVRPYGIAPKDFRRFNGPTVLLADIHHQPVVEAGETLACDVMLAHFGYEDIPAGTVEWTLGDLTSGSFAFDKVETGFTGLLKTVEIPIPAVDRAQRVELKIKVAGRDYENTWPIWVFPKRERKSLAGVAVSPKLLPWFQAHYTDVVALDSAEVKPTDAVVIGLDEPEVLKKAIEEGRRVLLIAPVSDVPDVSLGWWSLGSQVGTAFKAEHAAFEGFPLRDSMDELWFRMIRKGALDLQTPLLDSVEKLEPLAVGEGASTYYLYMGEGNVGKARVLATFAVALLQDTPEALALLDCLTEYLRK